MGGFSGPQALAGCSAGRVLGVVARPYRYGCNVWVSRRFRASETLPRGRTLMSIKRFSAKELEAVRRPPAADVNPRPEAQRAGEAAGWCSTLKSLTGETVCVSRPGNLSGHTIRSYWYVVDVDALRNVITVADPIVRHRGGRSTFAFSGLDQILDYFGGCEIVRVDEVV